MRTGYCYSALSLLMSPYRIYTCHYATICSTANQRSRSDTELSSYIHVWDYEMCSLVGTCVLPQSNSITVSAVTVYMFGCSILDITKLIKRRVSTVEQHTALQ
jgi:hypothetical protein